MSEKNSVNYYCKYGLLHAMPQSKDEDINENSFLFSYLELEYSNSKFETSDKRKRYIENLCINISKARVKRGLFHNYPFKAASDENVTHDTITAICTFSHKYGFNFHKEIWHYLKRNWFFYSDRNHKNWRKFLRPFIHPRDLLFIGALNGNKFCIKHINVLVWICQISCKKKYKYRVQHGKKIRFDHTDGKLLALIRADTLGFRDKIDGVIKDNPIFGSWSSVFAEYFKDIGDRVGHQLKNAGDKLW